MAELEGIDYKETGVKLDTSISTMEQAIELYDKLKCIADQTPYNYSVYWKLVLFDYYQFGKVNGLNSTVFSRVSFYLGYGDVRSCYDYTLKKCRIILGGLILAKKSINAGVFPEMKNLWRLNQSYSDTLQFGQYVAEVFHAVGSR